jgi:hypothetical protein
MSEQGQDKATALVPVAQRRVELLDGDEVLAVRAEDGAIYLPLRPICVSLGLSYQPQRRRIQRDPALEEGMREMRLQTGGGRQATACMALNLVPYWLSTVEVSRVRPELQDKLMVYRRWVIERVFEAFQRETGIGQATAPTASAPVARDDETLSLVHIRDMGLAIAAFAEQQIAFAAQQQAQDRRIDILEEGHGQLGARLDRAAGVVGGLVRSVKALEQRLAPGNVLSEEQAAEVSDRVKTVAEALTARDVAAGAAPRDWYGSLYRTLYKRYNVAGYRRIRQEQYADVLSWLDDFHTAASPASQANDEE